VPRNPVSTHLIKWDVHTQRCWSPLYFLDGGRFDADPIPPMVVVVSVEFDDDQAARDFEGKIRDLLLEAM